MLRIDGQIVTRSDGIRLLLSPYRQALADGARGKGLRKVQLQSYARETGMHFGCVRSVAGQYEVLLGRESDVYPLGEMVYDQLGSPDKLFFVEQVEPGRYIVVAATDHKVVLDELVEADDLAGQYELILGQFGEAPFTLAASSEILGLLAHSEHATVQELSASTIDAAQIQPGLKLLPIASLSRKKSKGQALKWGLAAGVVAALVGGYLWKSASDDRKLQEEMSARLARLKSRSIDPLAEYKRAMHTASAADSLRYLSGLIEQASAAHGWVPKQVTENPGEPVKILMSTFGGRRAQIVEDIHIQGAQFGQDSQGVVLLVDPKNLPERADMPHIEPLSKVLFETLDALDSNGFATTHVGELASFTGWSTRKVQVTFDSLPLAALDVIADTLGDRPINVTQANLNLEGQRLSGSIQLDVYGS
jgi:hypothetical protein